MFKNHYEIVNLFIADSLSVFPFHFLFIFLKSQRYNRQRYGGNVVEELSPARQIHGTSNSNIIAGFQRAHGTDVVLQLDITTSRLHLSPGHSAMRAPTTYDNAMKVALPNECSTFATSFPSSPPAHGTGMVLPVL